MRNPRSIRSSDMKKAREEAERERDEMIQKEKDEEKRFNASRYKQGVRTYSKEAVNTPPNSMLGKAAKFVRTKIGDPFERTFGPDKYAEGPDAGELRARREYLGYKKGGHVKESKAMMRKEVSFMKKKGAPKSMIKHEMREMADKAGRAMKKRTPDTMGRAMVKKMYGGGMSYSGGGSASSRADGIASKGKTKGKIVKMRYGGEC